MKVDVDVAIRVDGVLLNPDELDLLVKLSRYRSMSRVARERGVTRSAVHKRIRNLEERLGRKLVMSSPSGSYLTKAARRIVIKYLNARAQVERDAVTVACAETVVTDVLSALGDLDGDVNVVVPPHEELARFEADVIIPDDPAVVFDRAEEATHDEPVEIRRCVLVRVGDDDGGFVEVPGSAQRLYLTENGIREPEVTVRVSYYLSAVEKVEEDGGWTVVPAHIVEEEGDGPEYSVMALPLTEEGVALVEELERRVD